MRTLRPMALAVLLGTFCADARAAPPACVAGPVIALDPAVARLRLGSQSYPRTLALCDHWVVLTFDDGPAPETTPAVLRALKDAGVHAAFFLIGREARLHTELARREMEDGHTVGHHSNTHPSFTLRGFDQDSAERDIVDGIASDERAIYGAGADPAHPHVPFFRFPGFADTPELLSFLDQKCIAVMGADLWASDWLIMTPEFERRRLMSALERRPHKNGIILLHDSKRETAEMLPDFLRDLKENGYHVAQLVYVMGAPVPPLTVPARGEPETQRIIAHLNPPIVPGTHHLAPDAP